MIDWKNFFTEKDAFEGDLSINDANTKLWAAIQSLEKVYGNTTHGNYHDNPTVWANMTFGDDTHSARIIDINKINGG